MTGVLLHAVAVLALAQAGQAGGVVQTAGGAPIAGAVVVAGQGSGARTRVTGDDGRFDLGGVELPVSIEVRAAGFTTVRRVVLSLPIAVTLAPSAIRESLVVLPASISSGASGWRAPDTGTTSIAGDAVRDLPAVTADEALRTIAGLSLFRRSSSRTANPTTHGVTMRGLSASGASRGLVLLDGVPLADGFGGWVTWTRLPALAIGSVEIDRGAQGATFGSDALGGVIAIAPPAGGRGSAAVDASFGSERTGTLDASGAGRIGAVGLFGAVGWFRTDGTIPVAPESRGAVDVATDVEWANAYGRAVWSRMGHRLTVSGWGSRDDRGNGTVLQRNRTSGGTAAVAWDGVAGATQVAARLSVSPNDYEQTFSFVAAGRATETLTSTQFIDTTVTRALIEAGRPLPRGYVTARAAIARASAAFTDRRPATTVEMTLRDASESVSLHAGWNPAAALTVGAGVRHEWRAAPLESAGKDAATVGHLSGAWRLGPRVVARGSASTSHRWPTLNELVRNFQVGNVLTLANPDLAPERARSMDAAVSVSGARWAVSAGGFWTVVEDAVANVTQSVGPQIVRRRENAGEARARGFEVDADARVGALAGVRLSALVVDARFRESAEPALEGNRLPQVPRVSVSVSGDVRPLPWLQAVAVWRGLSSQFDDDRNVFRLGRARQLDLKVGATCGAWMLHATVENVLDARLEVGRTPLVTIGPGRAARVGVTWRGR